MVACHRRRQGDYYEHLRYPILHYVDLGVCFDGHGGVSFSGIQELEGMQVYFTGWTLLEEAWLINGTLSVVTNIMEDIYNATINMICETGLPQ